MDDQTMQILKTMVASAHVMRSSQFEMLRGFPGDVVCIGDSITEGNEWTEWFPAIPIRNRGIGGDTTDGVLARLATSIGEPPCAVFLLIGINDIGFGIEQSVSVRNFTEIIGLVRRLAPEAEMIIQSVMPSKPDLAPRILALNHEWERLAQDAGATYIDLWPSLAVGDRIDPSITDDDTHLNGRGYQRWATVLRPIMERLVPGEGRTPADVS